MDGSLPCHFQCLLPVNGSILPQPRAFPPCCLGMAGSTVTHTDVVFSVQDVTINTGDSVLKLITWGGVGRLFCLLQCEDLLLFSVLNYCKGKSFSFIHSFSLYFYSVAQ